MAKCSRSAVRGRSQPVDTVTFEDQSLTRFAGLAVLQRWLADTGFKERLRRALRGVSDATSYGYHALVLVLILHYLLGWRRLQEVADYRDDPMVARTLGLQRLPSVAALSRLDRAPPALVEHLRGFMRDGVAERITASGLRTVTLDFDGTVQSTRRRAEGSAVGYNSQRKGERSYYPLLCTVAQLGEVFDVAHRPGNVHDSRGAAQLIDDCVARLRRASPGLRLEARLDTAFGHPSILETLADQGVAFTTGLNFTSSPRIKDAVERRRHWHRLDGDADYFELPQRLRPDTWARPFRVIVVRQKVRGREHGPIQLDLFEPVSSHYRYKAIVTNRRQRAATVVAFHEGRGEQEGLIGELKADCGVDRVPAKRLVANQIHLLASLIGHNVGRELQITAAPGPAHNTVHRAALWTCQQLSTLRRQLLWQPARLVRPNGKLTLALGANTTMKARFLGFWHALAPTHSAAS